MRLRWCDWVYVVGIALNVLSGVLNLTVGEYGYGATQLSLAFFICVHMFADRERERLRGERVITQTINVTQNPGESSEVFAARLAGELSKSTRWMR